MSSQDQSLALKKYIEYYETLSPETVSSLRDLATEDLFFKDPFNEVTGVEKVEKIMSHMFETTVNPRFLVHKSCMQGAIAFLKWSFSCSSKGSKQIQISGVSEIGFNDQAQVVKHIDHWDAAEQFYEHVPVVGFLLRLIKKKLKVQ